VTYPNPIYNTQVHYLRKRLFLKNIDDAGQEEVIIDDGIERSRTRGWGASARLDQRKKRRLAAAVRWTGGYCILPFFRHSLNGSGDYDNEGHRLYDGGSSGAY
jgi:hypothetical protein